MTSPLRHTALLITANRRPEYLRATLASWARAPEIRLLGRVSVKLAMSNRWDDMIDVVREAEGVLGRPVEALRDSEEARSSPGMHRALGEGVDWMFRGIGARYVICGEEDVIVSSDVLSYFEWAQHWYGEGTLCALAHNRGGTGWDGLSAPREDQDADQAQVRRLPYFNPWGWMVSRGVWQSVMRPVWDWDCDSGGVHDSGYDWNLQRLAQTGPWSCLVPDAARSQTIGEHGGWASTPEIFPMQQSRSFRLTREDPEYRLRLED
jgi:hypothetical protein